jgi:hypothetical protein
MNEELLALQTKVNGVIYNPFINLKDHIKDIKKNLIENGNYKDEIAKLNIAFDALDQLENLPYGNIERIKGFNKIKSQVLRLIKEILSTTKP